MSDILNKLILASNSSRRLELLKKLGLAFSMEVAEVEELKSAASCTELTEHNAELKAQAVAQKHPQSWVIGSDTLICFNGHSLGKPRDLADAKAILTMLSGAKHEVISAVAIINLSNSVKVVFSEKSEVYFKKLSAEIIEEYLRLVYVLDKAGAYALQEHGDMIIDHICGSWDNIVGLPTERLNIELNKLMLEYKF